MWRQLNKYAKGVIAALNEQGAGWYIEDNYLYTKMFSCPCPMLEKRKEILL